MSRTKPCVLLCGFTGVGKTSIAQHYCGKNTVPDSAIGHGCATTSEFTYYQSKQLDIWDYRGFEPGEKIDAYLEELKKFAKKCYINNGLKKCPQIVLYCIQGPGARITNIDIDILKAIPLPTMVLITKDDITRPNQRKAILNRLIAASIPQSRIRYCSSENSTGFQPIVEKVQKLQPIAEKRLEELKKECFIATKVFGSRSSDTVVELRNLRDQLLIPSRLGRRFVFAYYNKAPDLAKCIPKNKSIYLLKGALSLLAKIFGIIRHCKIVKGCLLEQ